MSRRLPPRRVRRALTAGLPALRRAPGTDRPDDLPAVWVFDYDAAGRLVFQGTRAAPDDALASGVVFAWAGRLPDPDLDLQYHRTRFHDPSAGAWLTQAPVGYHGGDPNLYPYVGNAPPGAAAAQPEVPSSSGGNLPAAVREATGPGVSPRDESR